MSDIIKKIVDSICNTLQSTSKMVFLLMAVALVAGLFVDKIEAKAFLNLASMAFGYYFGEKSDNVAGLK